MVSFAAPVKSFIVVETSDEFVLNDALVELIKPGKKTLSFACHKCCELSRFASLGVAESTAKCLSMGIHSGLLITSNSNSNSMSLLVKESQIVQSIFQELEALNAHSNDFDTIGLEIVFSAVEIREGIRPKSLLLPKQSTSSASSINQRIPSEKYRNVNELIASLELCLQERSVLVSLVPVRKFMETSMNSQSQSQQVYSSSVVGPCGNIFLSFTISQQLQSKHASKNVIIHREVELVVILLASAEVLTHRPLRNQSILIAPRSSITDTYRSENDEQKRILSRITSLQAGLQALTTLNRVVQVLRDRQHQNQQLFPSNHEEQPSKLVIQYHIPYRDSNLTLFMKPYLEGNINMMVLTCIRNNNSDSMINLLRFSADIGALKMIVKPIRFQYSTHQHQRSQLSLDGNNGDSDAKSSEINHKSSAKSGKSPAKRSLDVDHSTATISSQQEAIGGIIDDLAITPTTISKETESREDKGSLDDVDIDGKGIGSFNSLLSMVDDDVEHIRLAMNNIALSLDMTIIYPISDEDYTPTSNTNFSEYLEAATSDVDGAFNMLQEVSKYGDDEISSIDDLLPQRSFADPSRPDEVVVADLLDDSTRENDHVISSTFNNETLALSGTQSSQLNVLASSAARHETVISNVTLSPIRSSSADHSVRSLGGRRRLNKISDSEEVVSRSGTSAPGLSSSKKLGSAAASNQLPPAIPRGNRSNSQKSISQSSSSSINVAIPAPISPVQSSQRQASVLKQPSSQGLSSQSVRSAQLRTELKGRPTTASSPNNISPDIAFAARSSKSPGLSPLVGNTTVATSNSQRQQNFINRISREVGVSPTGHGLSGREKKESSSAEVSIASAYRSDNLGDSHEVAPGGNIVHEIPSEHQNAFGLPTDSFATTSAHMIDTSNVAELAENSHLVDDEDDSGDHSDDHSNDQFDADTHSKSSSSHTDNDNSHPFASPIRDSTSSYSLPMIQSGKLAQSGSTVLHTSVVHTTTTSSPNLLLGTNSASPSTPRSRLVLPSVVSPGASSNVPSLSGTTPPEANGLTKSASTRSKRAENSPNAADVQGEDSGDNLSPAEKAFLRNVASSRVEDAAASIRSGVKVGVKNGFGRTAMQIAARNGCVPMLEMLLHYGGDLWTRGRRGETLLHLAANNGHLEAMVWLHRAGIPKDVVDITGQSLVHVAARRLELAVLQYLHEDLCLDFNLADFEDQVPIQVLPRFGPEEDIKNCRRFIELVLRESGYDVA